MNIFIAVLTDLCHFLKIIMAMNLFGNFNKSNSKYNKILIIGIIAMSSNIIFFDTNMVIDLIVYFVTTYVVFRICYVENKRVLLLFSIWIPFMMSMIDTMFLILVKILFRLLSVSLKSVEEFMASILSLIFIYVLGYIYRKHYKYGLKKIEYKNLSLLTALVVVNTVVVLVVAKVATEELTGKHKLLSSGAFIAVIVGVFVQLGAVVLLKVSKNISQEKELIKKLNSKKFKKDKINNFTVFAHGYPGKITFGYNYEKGTDDDKLAFKASKIKKISKKSFGSYPTAFFYSCRTASTEGNNKNFAKKWQKHFGGETYAFEGRTDYAQINYKKGYSKLNMKLYEWIYGDDKKFRTAARQYPTGDGIVKYADPVWRPAK
nr:hypothetical protein [uncultured Eubacterium sp.]